MSESEEKQWSRAESVKTLWGIACHTPEESRGILTNQVRVCKMLYVMYGYEPALQRLNEISHIARSRTKGNSRGQKSAARLLTQFLKSIKVDKSEVC